MKAMKNSKSKFSSSPRLWEEFIELTQKHEIYWRLIFGGNSPARLTSTESEGPRERWRPDKPRKILKNSKKPEGTKILRKSGHLSQENRDRWVERYLNGESRNSISESEGIHSKTLGLELKSRGIIIREPHQSTEEQIEICRKAYEIRQEERIPWKDIQSRLGIKNPGHTHYLARIHAKENKLPWPLIITEEEKKKPRNVPKYCSVPGCEGIHRARGFCKSHYSKKMLELDQENKQNSQNKEK